MAWGDAATEAQVRYVRTLLAGRSPWDAGLDGELAERALDSLGSGKFVSRGEASAIIEALRAAGPPAPPQGPPEPAPLDPGLYQHEGRIYKVQVSRTSGKPYAKVLVPISGTRLTAAGAEVHADFQYAPGAVLSLSPAERMTFEEAKQFGIEHGYCCRCGRGLRDAKSVERGIGPVCRKAFL